MPSITYPFTMSDHLRLLSAFANFVELLSKEAGEQLKALLEGKHLYQKVTIDFDRIKSEAESRVLGDDIEQFRAGVGAILERENFTPSVGQLFAGSRADDQPAPTLVLLLRNIKLFCSSCDTRETYAPVWYADITNEVGKPMRNTRTGRPSIPRDLQLYALMYFCQNCNGLPEAFLVRRKGWTLFLEGRSPLEHIEVPTYIPKPERSLFRDALVAIHGGKILGGLFYLRTFIEQFARRQTKQTGRLTGDELLEAYAALLPPKQRDLMPSLREWYDRISDAIHAAREDPALFEAARENVERHFEILKVFKIQEL